MTRDDLKKWEALLEKAGDRDLAEHGEAWREILDDHELLDALSDDAVARLNELLPLRGFNREFVDLACSRACFCTLRDELDVGEYFHVGDNWYYIETDGCNWEACPVDWDEVIEDVELDKLCDEQRPEKEED